MCSLVSFQEGETVLISAARDGHLEVVRTLLSKYADVEAADAVSSINWNISTSSCSNNSSSNPSLQRSRVKPCSLWEVHSL